MNLSLFDLHCDTAYEMARTHQSLSQNDLAVSLSRAKDYQSYYQVAALWTPPNVGDEEGYHLALSVLNHLCNDPSVKSGDARIASLSPIHPLHPHAVGLIPSVEDAKILNGKIERLDTLYGHGVRILTPLWAGETEIGGAHDTNQPLTRFGKEAVAYAADLGMTLDISHASPESAKQIFSICEQKNSPVIASHSNLYDLCPVSRNLFAWQWKEILQTGGLIGVNLHTFFLRRDGGATLSDVVRHIDGWMERGCEEILCLGCDMDGAVLPAELCHVDRLYLLATELQRLGYPDAVICALFFENAFRFAKKQNWIQ